MRPTDELLNGAKLGLILLAVALCAELLMGRGQTAGTGYARQRAQAAGKTPANGPPSQTANPGQLKSESVRSIQLISESTGWALTESRLLWTSTLGRQWKAITPPLPGGKVLEAFFIDPSTGWAVLAAPGDGRGVGHLALASTSNGGDTWSFATLLPPTDYRQYEPSGDVSINFVDPEHGWVLVKLASSSNFSRGLLLASDDGGNSWRRLPAPPAAGSIRFISDRDGWLAGGPGTQQLYVTRDGGLTWSPVVVEAPGVDYQTAEPNFDLPSFEGQSEGTLPVTFVGAGVAAVGFYETGDGGRSWRIKQTLPVPYAVSNGGKVAAAVVALNLFVIGSPGDPGVTVVADGKATRRRGAVVKDFGPGAGVSAVDFKSGATGWVLTRGGRCAEFKSRCEQETRLLATNDGGGTLVDVTPQAPSARAPSANGGLQSSDLTAAAAVFTSRNRKGFDKCAADTVSNMQTWWSNSPYYDSNIYIGGVNRGCSQSNLTSSWVSQIFAQGWGLIPTWVGPQATCTTCASCSVMSSDPGTAASQGVNEANSASNAAAALGLANTIIYYDMERYNPTTSCQNSVRAFINAWVQQMHARGNLAGVYGSPQNAQEDWAELANPPDAVWIAKWDGNAGVFGLTPLSDSYWVNDQRIHQYQGGHNETYGGITFNIDNDFEAAPVAGPASQALPNLTPYQPTGWSDKIVVSNVTGTSTDGSLKTSDTLYVDWAIINSGSAATGATFYTRLYVDGVERASWFTDPPLGVNSYAYIQDYAIGSLSAGTHTIKITTDATGAVSESGEADNEFMKTVTVTSPGQPNLTPYQPSGWSDKTVVSNAAGTSTDAASLKTTDTLYVDWAVTNNGVTATGATFYTRLLVDGVEKASWYTDPPLNVNFYVYVQDYPIGSLSAGTHTIKVVTDSAGSVAESNESDNEYTKTITVAPQSSCFTLTTNVSPAGGGTISRNVQPNCSSGGALASQHDASPQATSPPRMPAPGTTSIGAEPNPQRAAVVEETFRRLVAKVEAAGSVRVIVRLDVPFTPAGALPASQARSQSAVIAQAQDALLSRLSALGARSAKKFPFIPYLAVEVDARALQHLEASSDVVAIEEDRIVPPALAESVPLIGGPAAWAAGFSGAGQTVAILDTGVDKTHPFLSGKVVSEACYSDNLCPAGGTSSTSPGSGVNCSTSISGCSHGTHVAGIAAGKGSSFSGVAKDATIIAIQVFTRFDSQSACGTVSAPCVLTYTSDYILGLQRVQALSGSFNIAAANMSLGGGRYYSNCDSSESAAKSAIDSLRSLGIATVISSGNDGYADSLGSPGCISTAVSVGATDDGSSGTDADVISVFGSTRGSNSASFLNLLAPGRWIYSSIPGGGFSNYQGTSMAAPHVTGAWAVLKSKAPTASVAQVLSALMTTGKPITDSRNNITKPRIQVDAALNALAGGQYTQGTSVTLTATPSAGYSFQSWSGCDSTSGSNCTVTMNSGKAVTASFTLSPPQAPTANAATNVTGGGFTANWSSSGGSTGYRLDVSTSSSFGSFMSGYQDLDVGNALSRAVGGLSAGGTYYYRVRAYNSGGVSGNSGVISVTTTTTNTLRIDNVSPKAGRASGGQQVMLAGSFAGLSSVTIGGTTVAWSYTSATTSISFTTPAHAVGAVSIVLTPTSGNTLTRSNAFAYLPTTFTDNILTAGVTPAKVQHIAELRLVVDALRAVAGLSPAPWIDPILVQFITPGRVVHITELRTYLEDAAARLGYAAATYTEPSLSPGSVVKRIHIEELRQRVKDIAG